MAELTPAQRLAKLEATHSIAALVGAKLDKIAGILTGGPGDRHPAAPVGLDHWLRRLGAQSPFTERNDSRRARAMLAGIDAPSASLIDAWEPPDTATARTRIADDTHALATAATARLDADRQRAILKERSNATGRAAASYAEIERHRAASEKATKDAAAASTAAAGLSRAILAKRAAALDATIDAAREQRAADVCASIAAAMPAAVAAEVVRAAGDRARETGREPGAALATAIRTAAAPSESAS